MHNFRSLYIFFIVLALNLFFFSTTNLKAKAFLIEDIEISEPFENSFDKNSLLNEGFKIAFNQLLKTLIKSSDFKRIEKPKLNQIKSMIESFSVKEEKFINQIYYVNIGVSFNKRMVFNYLENKNIFPSQTIKKTFLLLPIIVDENSNDLRIFSENPFYKSWNDINEKSSLVNYLLPTEDLEDLNLIKNRYNDIEDYNFKEIIDKYFLEHSIIPLIFKNNNETTVLSKINIKEEIIIKNDSFKSINFDNKNEINILIEKLKNNYEDLWKDQNLINTSIKLSLFIKVDNENLNKSLEFEDTLNNVDLISDYKINKFDKNHIYYEVVFNGTPKNFINIMSSKNYNFNIQKKIWVLK
tara:strand:+ start:231 stop:1292 length:1062 start_codon:yes stop_codon:yes gene_type:complete